MLSLQAVDPASISRFMLDFQKKSKCLEFPPETAECVGIYNNNIMCGYFIIQGYNGVEVEINQGYLRREFRHFGLPAESMRQLEDLCKKAGYKKMLLGTHNRFKAYLKFAKSLGYTPEHLIFSKNLGA